VIRKRRSGLHASCYGSRQEKEEVFAMFAAFIKFPPIKPGKDESLRMVCLVQPGVYAAEGFIRDAC